ncbi:glycosyltransferase family 4 protein [Mycolicibacterium diernhoferi]|nr:glycosyltransferase family 4 protein [Mycolicibacterium diernhoferi]QYL21188.1 glycosyltransferase family 4 protein [Mycolicibacterium diernhoferi]
MRVLQVSDGYPPATGGTERVVEALSHGLAARGHRVAVATLGRPDAPDTEVTETGVEIHRIDGVTRWLRRFASDPGHLFHPTFPDPLLVRHLQKLVDDFCPDIVHAHGWILNSCLGLRLSGAAMVTTLHDYGLRCANKTLISFDRLEDPCAGPSLGRCLACTRDHYGTLKGTALALGLRDSWRQLDKVSLFFPISEAVEVAGLAGVRAERVCRIPSFVDDAVFDEARLTPRPSFLPNGPFVAFVGALGDHKGLGLAVAAHQRMRAAVPLVVIGSERADTQKYVGTPTRPVRTLTRIPHPEIMATFAAAAVAVVPSRWQEPLGLVAVEAMAAGTPVVATRVGALPEVVEHGKTGLIVPPNDPSALAAALDEMVGDPRRAESYGACGSVKAHDYCASVVVPKFIAAYRRALDGPQVDQRGRSRTSPTA